MTKEDVIRMAREAGEAEGMAEFVFHPVIERFAKLVAQHEHEREACAKIGDDHPSWSSRMYSATIRARGQV
jgi:hypothetical protein